jgi:hypothetical protein
VWTSQRPDALRAACNAYWPGCTTTRGGQLEASTNEEMFVLVNTSSPLACAIKLATGIPRAACSGTGGAGARAAARFGAGVLAALRFAGVARAGGLAAVVPRFGFASGFAFDLGFALAFAVAFGFAFAFAIGQRPYSGPEVTSFTVHTDCLCGTATSWTSSSTTSRK